MAVTLPKARRERAPRVKTARSVTSGDVPVISSSSDPGLRVPLENEVGESLQAASEVVGEAGDAAVRIVQRDEGLRRDSDDRAYTKFVSDTTREFEAAGDASDPEAVKALGDKLGAERDRILAEHKGGDISRQLLKDRLDRRHTGVTDQLAVMNISAANERMRQTMNKRLNALTQDVLVDPDVLISPDPMTSFRQNLGKWEDEIEFMELPPAQARAARQIGKAQILNSMVTSLIQNNQTDRAKQLMRSEEVAEAVDPGVQRDIAQRIVNVENELNAPNKRLQELQEVATFLAGPNAQPEEVRQIAQRLEGLKEGGRNLEVFHPGAGSQAFILDMDKGGEVVAQIGPTPEEQAEHAARMERSKALGKFQAANTILSSFGTDINALPLPTATGTTAAKPKAEGDGTTTAKGPKGPGGEAIPGSDLPIFTDGDLYENPFAEEQEEPISDDFATVTRLMAMARSLQMGGLTNEARGFFAEAKFIAENSEQIKRKREMEKMLDPRMAGSYGLNVGATMQDIVGKPAINPIAEAEDMAAANLRGRQRTEGEETTFFIAEARDTIEDLLLEVADDPTIVGVGGALRSTGRNAFTAIGDLGGRALVDAAREIADTELGLDDADALFDNPELSSLDILENSIGLMLARIQTPSGQRIPVEVIKRSIDSVGLKGTTGSEVIVDRLKKVDKFLKRRQASVTKRFGIEAPVRDREEDFDGGQGEAPEGTPRFRVDPKTKKLVPVE